MRVKLKYLSISLVLLLIEVIIALFLHDNIIRPYIGDILAVILVYCAVRAFAPDNMIFLPLYVFLFAVFIELLQFAIVPLLHFGNNTVLKTIVGSVFDWVDILCYFIGALLTACIQWIDAKREKMLLPSLFIAAAISVSVFVALAYNGLWWPVNPELMGYEIKGIDVARYQGDIDWKAIYEQDIRFAFIKATEGSSYIDPLFQNNIVESKRNGIANGAYHFFSTQSPGKDQAAHFIATISPYYMKLPPVLDFEVGSGIDKSKTIAEVTAFLEETLSLTGTKPIIYTTYESFNMYLSEGFADYDFWFRDLLREPSFGGHWIFWQYCNRGRLKGIDKSQKYVDLNVFVGNEQEFVELISTTTD